MTYEAVIHYFDGSTRSISVEIGEETLLHQCPDERIYIGQRLLDNQKLLHGVFDYNCQGYLTNGGNVVYDGWQKILASSIDHIEVRFNSIYNCYRYICMPPGYAEDRSRRVMINQLERAFA